MPHSLRDSHEVTAWRFRGAARRELPRSLTIPSPAKYREMMRACNAVDYDEQIMLACKLLRENGDIRQEWAAKAKHLLVDEYQDINAAQFDLIRLLSKGQTEGLYVVGDDDQS